MRSFMREHNRNAPTDMETFDSIVVLPFPQAQRARRATLQLRALLAFASAQCIDLLQTWQRRAAERAALAAMNPRELRDIGLARNEVLVEADKPFWRA
jgi:uncharacterized protein YjiS (DUF1127 family)